MERRPLRIVLTGFMGTGKTTVGRAVARHLGWTFVDTDELVVTGQGPVEDIFEAEGEAGFRAHERAAAVEAARERRAVVATGGGTMLDEQSAEVLGRDGRVFCLTAPTEVLLGRVTAAGTRPLLAGPDARSRALALLEERRPHYETFEQVLTEGRSPDRIATEIIERWAAVPPGPLD